MKLSRIAILAIRGSKGIVPKLAEALGVSEQTIYRYLNDETDDNLTKAAALTIIRNTTGLSDDQILMETISEEAGKS